jgi:hypothetical protein
MSDNTITPSGMGGSAESRKVVSGWKAIRAQQTGTAKPVARQPINENVQKISETANVSQEEPNGVYDSKRGKQFLKEQYQQATSLKKFRGPENLCMLKMCALYESSKNTKVQYVKEAGFGVYEIGWSEG